MARFMTRVVLHDAANDREIYEKLHEYMAAAGFSKTIKGALGSAPYTGELPDAMYDYHTTDEAVKAVNVKDKAKAAAGQTKKRYSVLTVEYIDWAGSGLTALKP